jgi:hypothetical protein
MHFFYKAVINLWIFHLDKHIHASSPDWNSIFIVVTCLLNAKSVNLWTKPYKN